MSFDRCFLSVCLFGSRITSAGFTDAGALFDTDVGPGPWPVLTFFFHFPLLADALLSRMWAPKLIGVLFGRTSERS